MNWARIAAILLLTSPLTSLGAKHSTANDKPILITHLRGTVVDKTGNAVDFATVELRDANDHHIIESTFADGNGKFSFQDRKHGEHLEIQASRAGFNITRYEVEIVRFSIAHLRIVLHVAT
jgi:hypothetical protein